ncbi:hypothetical protein GCM10010470_09510 [Saccharopolyspora taberi]|uniref:Uncharacterized protein n=1 Tax=Saccharopolyspora taberi TaxID=60895 RepID=A0ABN3V4Z6_9PSEU
MSAPGNHQIREIAVFGKVIDIRACHTPRGLLHLDDRASTLMVNQSPRAGRRCRVRDIDSRDASPAVNWLHPTRGEDQDWRVPDAVTEAGVVNSMGFASDESFRESLPLPGLGL